MILEDLQFLYELSLNLGRSLDPHETSRGFLRTLTSRKSLTGAAIWWKDGDQIDLLGAIPKHDFQNPNLGKTLLNLVKQDQITICHPQELGFHTLLGEGVGNAVICAIFPLGAGVLLLQSTSQNPFTPRFLAQLRAVLFNLANSLQGGIAHQKVKASEAELLRRTHELMVSRTLLKNIVDTLPIRVFWKDKDSHYLGCNPSFARDAGKSSPEELIGRDDYAMGWAEQADLYVADDQNVMATGESRIGYEEPQTTPDGTKIWLRTSKVPIRDPFGEVSGILGMYEDITSRKATEEALRLSEERFNLAMRASNDGMWDWNMATETLYFSPRWKSMLGYQDAELENSLLTWGRLIHPEQRGMVFKKVQECLSQRLEGLSIEYQMRHKEGHWVDILSRAVLVCDAANQPVRMVGTHLDISGQRRIERELRQRDRYQRAVLDNFPFLVWLKDTDSRYLAVNQPFAAACKRMATDEVGGLTDYDLWPDDLAETYRADDKDVLLSGTSKHIEEFIETPEGRQWVETYKSPVRLDGQTIGTVGFARNITDRKMIEEKLIKSQQSLSQAQRIARLGNWWLNFTTGELHWSDEIYRIFGQQPDAFEPSYERFFSMVHPDDVAAIKASEQEAFARHQPHSIDHRIVLSDGSIRWVHEEAIPTFDTYGQMIYLAGTVQDITERKSIEDELRNSLLLNTLLIQTMFDGIAVCHALDVFPFIQFIVWNPAIEHLTGFTCEEINQQGIFRTIFNDPTMKGSVQQRIQQLLQGEDLEHENWVMTRKDGQRRTVEITSRILHVSQNQFHIMGVVRDVTEQHAAQEVIRQSEAKLRMILDSVDAYIYMKDMQGHYLFANAPVRKLWNRNIEEIVGFGDDQFFDAQTTAHIRLTDSRVLMDGEVVREEETTVSSETGSPITFLSVKLPLRHEDGTIYALCGISTDITQRKQLESELLAHKVHLEQLVEEKTRDLINPGRRQLYQPGGLAGAASDAGIFL